MLSSGMSYCNNLPGYPKGTEEDTMNCFANGEPVEFWLNKTYKLSLSVLEYHVLQ